MEDILAAKEEGFANPQGADNIEETARPPRGETPSLPREKAEGLTQNVARRIKEERQKAKEEFMADVFGSEEEFNLYKEAKREKAAREEQMQREALENYRSLEEAYTKMALASDPVTGEIFKNWEKEINEFSQKLEIEDEAAFLFLLGKRLPDILAKEREKAEQDILAKIIESQKTPGSLSGGEENFRLSALNDKEFALLLEKVKMGEIAEI